MRVAEGVVDGLEAVEVDQHDRRLARPRRRRLEQGAGPGEVAQAGERVVERGVRQLALEQVALVHVAGVADDPPDAGVVELVDEPDLHPAPVPGPVVHAGHRLDLGAGPGEEPSKAAPSAGRSSGWTTSPIERPSSSDCCAPRTRSTDGLAQVTRPSVSCSVIRSEAPVTSARNSSSRACSRSVRTSRSRLLTSCRAERGAEPAPADSWAPSDAVAAQRRSGRRRRRPPPPGRAAGR